MCCGSSVLLDGRGFYRKVVACPTKTRPVLVRPEARRLHLLGEHVLPQDRLSALRRIGSLSRHLKKGSPSQLAATVLRFWLRSRFPHLQTGGLPTLKYFEGIPEVRGFAGWLGGLKFFDAAFWLASAYARWVSPEIRDERALFFTPPQLAARLIDNLVQSGGSLTSDKWMDPACGGAAFLAPIATRMAEELRIHGKSSAQIIRHIETHLLGADIDPFLCCLSRYFVKMALSDHIKAARVEPKISVAVCNALRALGRHQGKIDVVVCNPPYRKMPDGEVASAKKDYDDVMEGQPNIYSLFFKLSLQLLKRTGIAGLITPTSFFSGQSFSKVRVLLTTRALTHQIDVVSSREGIFVGVEQETAITMFRPAVSSSTKHVAAVFTSGRGGKFMAIGHCTLPDNGHAWPVPRKHNHARAITLVNGSAFRLKDYGYRPRVGSYVDYRERQVKRIYYKVPRRSGQTLYPLIWSSDISPMGTLQLGRQNSEAQPRYIRVSARQQASLLKGPSVALQRVTSSDQPRRLVAAVVPPGLLKRYGGAIGENHVVFLEQVGDSAKVAPDVLAKILRSSIIDRYFRCISGAANVSVFELNQLPLPDPELVNEELIAQGGVNAALVRAFRKQQCHE